MLVDKRRYNAGVTAELHTDGDGCYVIQVFDAELGDTRITGFCCEAEARTFLLFGDFDDTRDNAARALAGLANLHWA